MIASDSPFLTGMAFASLAMLMPGAAGLAIDRTRIQCHIISGAFFSTRLAIDVFLLTVQLVRGII